MSLEVTYDDVRRGVILEYRGETHGDELVKIVREVFDSDYFDTLRFVISDRTHCTRYDIETRHIRQIAQMTEKAMAANPNLVVALVSPADVQFGMSRMYQSMTERSGLRTKVCRTREEAESWVESQARPDSLCDAMPPRDLHRPPL